MNREQSEEIDIGETPQQIISFFESGKFKLIVIVLSFVGIVFALSTGGLRTSGIPSVEEQVRPKFGGSGVRSYESNRPKSTSNVQKRFDAMRR